MVSIRKRRHLGIQERYKILNQLSSLNGRQHALEPKVVLVESSYRRSNMDSLETGVEKKPVLEAQPGPCLYMSGSSSKDMNNAFQGHPVKSRKSSRRKQSENQDTCMLRGVYYKNMKWQAAIKVEKKQIHLGTVASMEEAAHLYDRAAYLCGRVPNFELSEEEKQELRGLQWEEFLVMTKEAIANKKKRKRVETCIRRRRTGGSLEDGEIDAASSHQSMAFDEPPSLHQQAASLAYFHQAPSSQDISFAANSPFP